MANGKRTSKFLDWEAAVDKGEDSESQLDEEDEFLQSESELETEEGPTHRRVFEEALDIQQEGEFLAAIAQKWCNTLPCPAKHTESLDDVAFPSVLARFQQPIESDGLFLSSSASSSKRTPYRAGERSKLTGLPLPQSRESHIILHKPVKFSSQPVPSARPKPYIPKDASRRRELLISWSNWASRLRAAKAGDLPLPILRVGQWVQIRRGKYRGDVGVIWEREIRQVKKRKSRKIRDRSRFQDQAKDDEVFIEDRTGYQVLLVPREYTVPSLSRTNIFPVPSNPISDLLPHLPHNESAFPSGEASSKEVMKQGRKRKREEEGRGLGEAFGRPQGSEPQSNPDPLLHAGRYTEGKRPRRNHHPLQRHTPQLFRPSMHPSSEVTSLGKDTYHHQRRLYCHGLLVNFLWEDAVEPTSVVPSELQPHLALSKHPLLYRFPMPVPDTWKFSPGEAVTYDHPHFPIVLNGTITEFTDATRCVVDFAHPQSSGTLERIVSTSDLRKNVEVGKYVSVVGGLHAGREGFVLEMHGGFVGLLERQNTSPNSLIFVHINSVEHCIPSFATVDIPWRDVKVTVIKDGRYKGLTGLVKDVIRSTHRLLLFVTVFLIDLECTEKFRYQDLTEYSTNQPLLQYQPLCDRDKIRFGVFEEIFRYSTGVQPWVELKVHIVGGKHKGHKATVKGVNVRTLDSHHDSTVELDLELHLFTPVQCSPLVKVNYAQVRELISGLLLEPFQPLREDQAFFKPIVKSTVNSQPIPWCKPKSIAPSALSVPPASPSNRSVSSPYHVPDRSPSPLDHAPDPYSPSSLDLVPDPSPAAEWRDDLDPGDMTLDETLDEWVSGFNLNREDFIEIHHKIWNEYSDKSEWRGATPERFRSASPAIARSGTPQGDQPPSHWILHFNLLGIPIHVDVKGGQHDTMGEQQGTFLTPEKNALGEVIVRIFGNDEVFELDPSTIHPFRVRPDPCKDKDLLVIARGPHQLIGKVGRQIHYFYNGAKTNENRWFILGIVEFADGVERLTEERLDVSPEDLEYVEESREIFTASRKLFDDVRKEARKKRPEVRTPRQPWYITT
ncbi:hypothetical protein VNI00_016475 [Paramarasmius palmivorus]|uniref:KOW domain-containing protein n=1 Tax=Paramarasmius palmivorus TaxID=297713 RepID=A0AAW0BFW2_9AGAR